MKTKTKLRFMNAETFNEFYASERPAFFFDNVVRYHRGEN